MNKIQFTLAGLSLICLFVISPVSVYGADTVETWDTGATDIELYYDLSKFDGKNSLSNSSSNFLIGYGLIDNLSGYLSHSISSFYTETSVSNTLNFGIFGTPVKKGSFQMDLFLDFESSGTLTPAFELNYNLNPDMSGRGFYLRGYIPVNSANEYKFINSILGFYCTFSAAHQFLLEINVDYNDKLEEDKFNANTISLGYNIGLVENFELITQLTLNVPKDDESPSGGFMIGFVSTIPAAK